MRIEIKRNEKKSKIRDILEEKTSNIIEDKRTKCKTCKKTLLPWELQSKSEECDDCKTK